MPTHRIPILGAATAPDSSGSVYTAGYDEFATNDVWKRLVTVFADTATRIGLRGGFAVPKNFVSAPSIVVVWTSTATAGNAVWDFDYRSVTGNDAASLDQAGAQESVTVTDAAPTAANNKLEATLALTTGNFAVENEVEYELFRDGADAGDTMAASALLFGLYFQYDS